MTFEQAQQRFQSICRQISTHSTSEELLQAQRDLDALEDQLRGKDGYDSIRGAIDDVYDKLAGTIVHSALKDIRSRDKIFDRASESLATITHEAGSDAKGLSLEKSRMVLPALNQSVTQIKDIVSAVKNDKPEEALTEAQTLLALVEQVKAKLTEK